MIGWRVGFLFAINDRVIHLIGSTLQPFPCGD
jgi:hypothetical protein